MISFIVVTVLNSGHGLASETSLRTRDIKALRSVVAGCAISHADFEEEILVRESCGVLQARLNAKAPPKAKADKSKSAKGWF